MSEQTAPRPFQVGDRVTVHGRAGSHIATGTGVIDRVSEHELDGAEYLSVWVRVDAPVMDDGVERKWITLYLEADGVTPMFSGTIEHAPTDPSIGAVTQPNPAPMDDTTPSLVELDRREAAADALADDSKHHGIDIRFDGDDERPSIYFRCDAPSDGLCHVVYDCSCESWHSEEMVDGIPQHRDSDDEVHMGRFVAECRLDDWFDNSDEVLSGDVTIPIRPEWVEGYYIFHVGGAS